MTPNIVIIGAGPTGLGAGWRLHELGNSSFHIYEKEQHVGGLASSYTDASGFVWDVGGHVLHSHYKYFDDMFYAVMNGEFFTHERESWVWIYDRFVPYPFQNNIHRLPKAVLDECLDGLKRRDEFKPKTIATFKDWMLASFGPGVVKHFLYPYNYKVWAYPPEQMNFKWVGDRVASVDIARIEDHVRTGTDDVSWGPNAVFQFPKQGGTGDIWNRVASRFSSHISYGKQVIQIDSKKHRVYFSDDTDAEYDVLLTSMPLDLLVDLIDGVVLPKASQLHYSRVSVVGIGIKGTVPEPLKTKCWMYFPEDTAPFFRATVFSNYSKHNAPKGTWSLMTETASSKFRPLPNQAIEDAVLEGAKRVKLIASDARIESLWSFTTDHGYPTPTLGRDDYVASVLPVLEKEGIYSRGRFGAWKYEVSNQDHTFMQGVEWANHVVSGDDEITVYHPEIVNAPKHS